MKAAVFARKLTRDNDRNGNHTSVTRQSEREDWPVAVLMPLIVPILIGVISCAPAVIEGDGGAFNAYVTRDGKQAFTFVTNTKLPSLYGNADPEQMHETWISKELAKGQYCLNGWEIESKTFIGYEKNMIIYKGVCK